MQSAHDSTRYVINGFTTKMKWLLAALCSMFFQQSFVTVGKVLPAILSPVILYDLVIDPSWLGLFFHHSAVALTVQAGCGSF